VCEIDVVKFGNSTVGSLAGSGLDNKNGGCIMGDSSWLWPSEDMDFWKINNETDSVTIKWVNGKP
jgi:hypothetical protein